MITREMIRCKHCGYLSVDKYDRWVCDDCGKEIHEIPDLECFINQVEIEDIRYGK